MKFREYLQNLNALAKSKPETLEFEVVTSRDDEGNGFNQVYYGPGVGNFEDGDFVGEDDLGEPEYEGAVVNAVCVN